VRIDDERIGELNAVLRPALLLEDPRRSRVRGVDVNPSTPVVRTLGERTHRIDGRKRGRADRRNNHGNVVEAQVIVDAFVVVVVGGLGSIVGSMVGSLIVGAAQTWGGFYVSEAAMAIMYAVMAAILLFRPWGLFGEEE